MKKIAALMVFIVLASVAFSGTAGYAAGSQIELKAQNSSGEDGTATFTDLGGGKIKVVIAVKNGTSEPQPAHIHKGTCANLDPKPEYPLTSVTDGKSETTLDVSVDELQKTDYAINIHKSGADIGTYVSCGDIKGLSLTASSSGSTTEATATTSTASTSGSSGSTTGSTGSTTSGTGNTTSGTTAGGTSSGSTTTTTSGSGSSTTSSSSGTSSNMPVTGVGDDPLPTVLVLLCAGLVAFIVGRKFTRREPEIL